jgi:hypothetical protein
METSLEKIDYNILNNVKRLLLKCLTFTKKPGLKIYAGDNKLSISEKTIL